MNFDTAAALADIRAFALRGPTVMQAPMTDVDVRLSLSFSGIAVLLDRLTRCGDAARARTGGATAAA